MSVDGHAESEVFSASGTAADVLIGQLRLGGDNSTSLGECDVMLVTAVLIIPWIQEGV